MDKFEAINEIERIAKGTEAENVEKVEQFDDKSFWDKVVSAAGAAGRKVIEIALTLYYALIDEDTPFWAKRVIVTALLYFVSPVDAIPDFVPVIGYSDDLAVLATALAVVAAHIKPKHRKRARKWVKRNL